MTAEELQRAIREFQYGKPDGVEFNTSINILLEEMDDWPKENITAFMNGIAEVLATTKLESERR